MLDATLYCLLLDCPVGNTKGHPLAKEEMAGDEVDQTTCGKTAGLGHEQKALLPQEQEFRP